jgi:hypothetical protein
MYNPALGTFLQRDPIEYDSDDSNLYRYCGNDPLDKTDPTGLDWVQSTITYEIGKCGKGYWNPKPDPPPDMPVQEATALANEALKKWMKKKDQKLVQHIETGCPDGTEPGGPVTETKTERTRSFELKIYVYFAKSLFGAGPYEPVISGDPNPDPNGHNGVYVVKCKCKQTIVDKHGPCVPCKKK